MKFRPIITDSMLQELTEHGTDEFPMSMDEQQVSNEYCARVKHWHNEIQITLVVKGSVLFKTPGGDFFIDEGQGIFFNSCCLHEAVPTVDNESVYICTNFHPKLIFGHSSSLIRRDYVDPVLFSAEIQVIALQDEPWHLEICGILRELARVNEAQQYGYEIEMKMLLCRIWMLILAGKRSIIEEAAAVPFADRQRMKALQQFIHQNYMEKITLSDIANTAHVSRGECCRVFQRIAHTTPFMYLISFRIAQSVKLLTTTDVTIAQIAQQMGFGSSSYYTECFKREMHTTPIEYRKHHTARG